MLPIVYCTRFLLHMLGLLQPEIREGFYISLPTSERRHRVREWINAQNMTFPVTYVPGVRDGAFDVILNDEVPSRPPRRDCVEHVEVRLSLIHI